MRIAGVVCVVGALTGTTARADGAAPPDRDAAARADGATRTDGAPALRSASPVVAAEEASTPAIAIGINMPVGWSDSIGASAYLGVLEHHAIRLNFATYKDTGHVSELIGELGGGDGVDHFGRVTDLGVAWVFYAQQRWNGVMFELGALRRTRAVGQTDEAGQTDRHSTVYAGRAMIGYSVTFRHVFFAAAAAGVSVGYESGTDSVRAFDGATAQTHLGGQNVTAEAYLRLGIVFGS